MKGKKNGFSIKRIKSSSDEYAEGIVALYNHFFPNDGTNYSEVEIRQLINIKYNGIRYSVAENITLAAILKNQVIGFIFCHFYSESRKAIVSYFAVKDSRFKTSLYLLSKLKKILLKNNQCDELFFESQGSGKALHRLFSERAKSIGLKVREFDFQYECPKVSLSGETREVPSSLFCIGLKKELPELITKTKMLEILHFILFECYGDLYDVKDKLYIQYHTHLQKMFEHYENTLPNVINTVEATKKLKVSNDEITLIIESGEGEFIEFKSTLRWNLKESKEDKKLEERILKAISAFNNGKGGELLIGVGDKKEIIGLENDYKSLKVNNKDKFELHLR